MNETIAAIVAKITVRYSQPTQIPGGHLCTEFYDCARLSPSDLARLAAHATGDLDEDEFDAVLGIAYSGIFFAAAVAGGRQVNIFQKDGEIYGPSLKGRRVLIVDDVVVTGEHLISAERKVISLGGIVRGYACVVDRSAGKLASEDKPLWSALQATLDAAG